MRLEWWGWFGFLLSVAGFQSALAADEPLPASSICIATVDGSKITVVHRDEDRFYGSPSWSHDDETIAYDSWTGSEQNYYQSEVFTSRPDGTEAEGLGRGAMPTWSLDDNRIGYHAYDNAFAVNVVSRDGSVGQVVSATGGSPRWRPVEKQISFGKSSNIALLDEASGKERMLLQTATPVYYGFAWSPDGKRVAYPTRTVGRWPNEIAVAEIEDDQPTQKIKNRYQGVEVFISVDWSPDGKLLLISLREKPESPYQLYTLEVDSDKPPRRIDWQRADRDNTSANWSHDGKKIVFVSKKATVQQ